METDGFCITNGGPADGLMRRAGLAGDECVRVAKRALAFALIAWLPLVILTAVQGVATWGSVRLPLLFDFSSYARFLIAGPLLIAAEIPVGWRLVTAASHFATSGVLDQQDVQVYNSEIEAVLRLRDCALVEIVIVLALAAFAYHNYSQLPVNRLSTWFATGAKVSLAGWWLILVSNTVFRFVLLRWIWRYLIWCRFLWRMSILNLHLTPTHPDHAGGLEFVALGQMAFGFVVAPVSVIVAGILANRVVYSAWAIATLEIPAAAFTIAALIVLLLPMLVFTPKMVLVRRQGLLDYGELAGDYVMSFDRKWVRGGATEGEELLGSPDIQSLSDMSHAFEVIEKMRVVPFSPDTVITLALAAIVPMVPLVLALIPLENILKAFGRLFSRIVAA